MTERLAETGSGWETRTYEARLGEVVDCWRNCFSDRDSVCATESDKSASDRISEPRGPCIGAYSSPDGSSAELL